MTNIVSVGCHQQSLKAAVGRADKKDDEAGYERKEMQNATSRVNLLMAESLRLFLPSS